jgi:hypothetical protein
MLWGTGFAVSSALYPGSIEAPLLFRFTLTLTLAVASAAASMLYLRVFRAHVLRHALIAASLWPALCVGLDLIMLMVVPPRLGIREYLAELGPINLVVAVVTLAVGLQRSQLEAHGH